MAKASPKEATATSPKDIVSSVEFDMVEGCRFVASQSARSPDQEFGDMPVGDTDKTSIQVIWPASTLMKDAAAAKETPLEMRL